jgi:hypothetical protein
MTAVTSKKNESSLAGEREVAPPAVLDRLAGLLPEGALEDAVKGLRPEELERSLAVLTV